MANKSAPEAKKKKTDGECCGIIRWCLFDGQAGQLGEAHNCEGVGC